MHDQLRPYVEKGLVSVQQHPTRDLFIYNYTQQCQFTKAWDEITLQCRGLILDGDGKVVARPLRKFFNYGEYDGPIPNSKPVIYEKVDGSLLIATLENGYATVFATRGSFTSDQAMWAKDHMFLKYGTGWMEEGWTYCFEIIYPQNRIVVDYGDREDLVLLAKIHTASGSEVDIHCEAQEWEGPRADVVWYDTDDIDEIQAADVDNEEGHVLHWPAEGLRLKVKFSTYVRLHRILTGVHARNIWEYMREGNSLAPLVELVPDEFMRWLEVTRDELLDEFTAVDYAARKVYSMRPATSNRGEFARWVHDQDKGLQPILFAMLDGKTYDDIIWKQIKPEAGRPFRTGEAA